MTRKRFVEKRWSSTEAMELIRTEKYERGVLCRFRAFSMDEISKAKINGINMSTEKTRTEKRNYQQQGSTKEMKSNGFIQTVPEVMITCPIKEDQDVPCNSTMETKDKLVQTKEIQQKPYNSNLAGRRAVPEITITCPPIGGFPDDDLFTEEYFTNRKYLICSDSPRTGKRKTCIVDFPNGLSTFEKQNRVCLESPGNFAESPVPFSCIDLAFAYTGPLNSPLTPPLSPRFRNDRCLLYPSPVPVFKLEESFPPTAFKDR